MFVVLKCLVLATGQMAKHVSSMGWGAWWLARVVTAAWQRALQVFLRGCAWLLLDCDVRGWRAHSGARRWSSARGLWRPSALLLLMAWRRLEPTSELRARPSCSVRPWRRNPALCTRPRLVPDACVYGNAYVGVSRWARRGGLCFFRTRSPLLPLLLKSKYLWLFCSWPLCPLHPLPTLQLAGLLAARLACYRLRYQCCGVLEGMLAAVALAQIRTQGFWINCLEVTGVIWITRGSP